MNLIPVESSNIKAIGYEDDMVDIQFHNGGTYRYYNVPAEVYVKLYNSESKGRFFHKEIKGKYDCAKLKEEPIFTDKDMDRIKIDIIQVGEQYEWRKLDVQKESV